MIKTSKPTQISLLLLALLLAALAAGCNGAASTPTPQETPQSGLALTDCELSMPNLPMHQPAQCGRLTVWENRAAGSGRQIELHIAVLPAISRSPAPDPLFFIPGGPGEAASEAYLSLSTAFETINQKRDIVLVDQRGTGLSHPLTCEFDDEDDVAESDEAVAAALTRCLEQLDADPRYYTTAIAMDDLDEVRQALGYAQINLYGASYGTRAALAYMRQYPDRVRSVILDGVVPMGFYLGVDAPQDAQTALDNLFARCAADEQCHAAYPNLADEWAQLLQWLEAQDEIEVALDHPINGQPTTYNIDHAQFTNLVHLLTYAPETAALLPLLIHTSYTSHDFERFAALSLANEDLLSQSMNLGMRLSVICAEDEPFFDQQPVAPGYLGDFAVRTFHQLCRTWPQGELPDGFTSLVQSQAPVLLISGSNDPVTPPDNAEEARQGLPNSVHIQVPGMGHINIHRGCMPRLATDFIESGSVQVLDAECAQNIIPMPFFLDFNGPRP